MSKSTSRKALFQIACLIGAVAIFLRLQPFQTSIRIQSTARGSQDKLITPDTVKNKIRILSWEPFILYIEDFIPADEREYLLEFSKKYLEPSTVLAADGSSIASDYRTSSTAFLPVDDPVVQRVAERASAFQGYLKVDDIQVTSYQQGQQYKPHVDWFGEDEPDSTTDRISTFFAILESDCSNCGTQFPLVPFDPEGKDPEICRFVDCEKDVLTSRNIPGGAVYWRNLDSEGEGRDDTRHAGLPAVNGSKVGLNIWTQVDITGEFFDRPSYHTRYGRIADVATE